MSSSSDEMALAVVSINLALSSSGRLPIRRRTPRRFWMRNWLRRREEGAGSISMLSMELRLEDPLAFRNFVRMPVRLFYEVLDLVRDDISFVDTVMRRAISAEHRLALSLRFLATGETYRSLQYSTRIHEVTISRIVPAVCRALIMRLASVYLREPQTASEWLKVASDFEEMWDYPLCLGALDGKHIVFRPNRDAGSYFYNYKKTHSIVLLAICDATYTFLYVDVGVNGRVSDGGVWRLSSFYQNMHMKDFPPACPLPGCPVAIPYHFIADNAFALSERLMKPFPERNCDGPKAYFNYRLSRARRVVESAFGILANRFRVLLSAINLSAEKVDIIVLAAVCLHNFLSARNPREYLDTSGNRDVSHILEDLSPDPVGSGMRPAEIRDILKIFFNNNRI